jgi:hypothetical protein
LGVTDLPTVAIIGRASIGSFRIGVWHTVFDEILEKIKKRYPLLDFDVQYYEMQLGARDATTGWRAVTYDDSETREMIIVTPQNRATMQTVGGFIASYKNTGITCDPLYVGDKIACSQCVYKVVNVKALKLADSFIYRECELEVLPLHEEV